ncbi:hypothetical protein TNCV_4195061 [Trichonephila clavipes]|nr:hypothetical protein TNCV_4195061 [Trichonephila clavipes]
MPPGKDSWCFYRRALAKGEKPAPHKLNIGTPINPDYLTNIVPIYRRQCRLDSCRHRESWSISNSEGLWSSVRNPISVPMTSLYACAGSQVNVPIPICCREAYGDCTKCVSVRSNLGGHTITFSSPQTHFDSTQLLGQNLMSVVPPMILSGLGALRQQDNVRPRTTRIF